MIFSKLLYNFITSQQMISETVLVVLFGVLVILQLEYLFDISRYVQLPYLKAMVVVTFTAIFLAALLLVYLISRNRKEQRKYNCHDTLSPKDYKKILEEVTEAELEKLKATKEFKSWEKAQSKNKAKESKVEEGSGVKELEKFEKEFGIVS